MTAFHGVRPHVPPIPLLPLIAPDPIGHRGARVTGGHPLMSGAGVHVKPRRWPIAAYLMTVLLPLAGVLVVLLAVRMAGQPSDQVIPPALQVSVSASPSACTFPDEP